jgi:chromosome segregation protein
MQSARQRQDYAERELGQIAEQLEAFARDKADVERKLAEVTESLSAETETLQRLTAEVEQRRKLIDERQQAFRDGQLRLNSMSQEVEQNKAAILDLMRKLAATNSRLGAIEIERKNIAAQQSRIAERRRVVVEEIAAIDAQKTATREKLDGVLAHIADQQAKLEACRAESQNLGKQIAQLSEYLGAAKEHRSGLISRQNLLKDLEAKREGVSEGVKSVLRERDTKFPFVRGLVADVLRVDVEHAHVIEAALDGRDQWLVTNDDDVDAAIAAREAFEDLEGRVNLLSGSGFATVSSTGVSPVSSESSETDAEHGRDGRATGVEAAYDWNQHPQKIRLAIDLVRFEARDAAIAEHLLGTTVIVDTLADAVELHRAGPIGYRYATHAGEVIEADGTLRAGPLTAAMGLLSRHAELEAIAQQIAEVDSRIEQLTAEVTEGNAAARELTEQENALRNEVYKSNTAKVELTSQIAQADDRLAALNREQPLLERELASFLEQIGRLKTEQTTLSEKRQAMDADQASRQQKVEELTASHQQLADEMRHSGEQLTAERVTLGQIQEKQLASQQQVQRQTAAQAELAQQVERIAKSAESVASRRGGVERELESAKAAEAQLVEKQQTLASQIETLVAQVQEAGASVQSLTERVEELRSEHAAVEQALHGIELKTGELKVRLETLVQRTLDELQLDLPHRYASLSEEGGPGYQPGDVDWDAVAEEIKELREKIHRLGNVNLDAIAEQDELEQRQTFLATQLKDLTESKAQLEQLIDEINTESGLRFEQTFNAVREHFQGMFRKLFGGGKADIYLELEVEDPKAKPFEGPDGQMILPEKQKVDILDAGIEIMAHPPGKKPATISQLSGGEKTMTCIALLMSIFKSKPSPFCILDEVDAALDEANNGRFNLIVEEFVEQSQFIVITHSKRTMQIADTLFGVTMQEQGVSKRVAVKFDQVDAHGRIKETAAA